MHCYTCRHTHGVQSVKQLETCSQSRNNWQICIHICRCFFGCCIRANRQTDGGPGCLMCHCWFCGQQNASSFQRHHADTWAVGEGRKAASVSTSSTRARRAWLELQWQQIAYDTISYSLPYKHTVHKLRRAFSIHMCICELNWKGKCVVFVHMHTQHFQVVQARTALLLGFALYRVEPLHTDRRKCPY